MAVGAPRFDKYKALHHRFYEPLFLLKLMIGDKPLGPHLVSRADPLNPRLLRHEFLENLSYICDSRKGGSSTASIGVEDRPEFYIFWLAVNQDDGGEAVFFLRRVLTMLSQVAVGESQERLSAEDDLLVQCVDHSKPRITKEWKALSSSVEKTTVFLRDQGRHDLAIWLERFRYDQNTPHIEQCRDAFSYRNHAIMGQLMSFTQELSEGGEVETGIVFHLNRVRHYIGRLAHHVRAARELIINAHRFTDVLAFCRVEGVPSSECAPPLDADNHTHLSGILKRMIRPSDSHKWCQVTAADLGGRIEDASILKCYQTYKPQVHAEVQVLEHFYRSGLRFAWDDRFIATSKPACVCCKLYFQHHPVRCVTPESHEKVYVNWGPIHVPGGREHPQFNQHRELMNKVIESLRGLALDQLAKHARSWTFHHDSVTGITPMPEPVHKEESKVGDVGEKIVPHNSQLVPVPILKPVSPDNDCIVSEGTLAAVHSQSGLGHEKELVSDTDDDCVSGGAAL